ncbi:MAG: DUF433 domain-containing protein [Microcoleaceae cyanobacterium]
MTRTLVDIGGLVTFDLKIQGGRPILAGTGTTVQRIVALYQQGYSVEDIVTDKDYLSLAQVHGALAYYYMNRQAIDNDLAAEAVEYDRLASLQDKAN